MESGINPASVVVWGGLAIAFVFGFVASRTNFCTMGAISDVVNMGHWGRMRMWMLTIAVALLGTSALHYYGLIDLSKSVYQRPMLPWLSLIVGGLLFGVGMTLAGGCANKNLVRLGGGSVRSLVVLVFLAIFSYVTMRGLFGQWRADFLDPVAVNLAAFGMSTQSLASIASKLTGVAEKSGLIATASVVGVGLLIFVLADKRFRQNTAHIIGAVLLGMLVVAAWYLTGHLGYGENPETLEMGYFSTNTRTLESVSFVAPVAYSLEMLMLWTDKSLHVTFGVATVIGVALGSFANAMFTRQFRWEGFASLEDLRTQLFGAMLMGFGGVTALGCTIGQGLSGISTLAVGSFLAMGGLICGAVVTMKWQQR